LNNLYTEILDIMFRLRTIWKRLGRNLTLHFTSIFGHMCELYTVIGGLLLLLLLLSVLVVVVVVVVVLVVVVFIVVLVFVVIVVVVVVVFVVVLVFAVVVVVAIVVMVVVVTMVHFGHLFELYTLVGVVVVDDCWALVQTLCIDGPN